MTQKRTLSHTYDFASLGPLPNNSALSRTISVEMAASCSPVIAAN